MRVLDLGRLGQAKLLALNCKGFLEELRFQK